MSKSIKLFIILATLASLFGLSYAYAQTDEAASGAANETIAEEVDLDENITAQDLGITDQNILPTSPFYFLKNWERNARLFFIINPIKKAERRLEIANEKLIEAKKLAETNPQLAEKTLEKYQNEIEKIKERVDKIKERAKDNPDIDKFLDKFADRQLKHQKLLSRLEEKLPADVSEKVTTIKEKNLQRFGEIMQKLEDRKDKITERLDKTIDESEGGKYKHFKNLEVLIGLEEKVPETAKNAIRKAEENALKRLHGDLEQMPPQDREKFKDYIDKISGNESIHLKIIQKSETEELPEETRTAITEAKEKVFEKLEKRLEKSTEKQKEEILGHIENGEMEDIRTVADLENNLNPATNEEIKTIKDKALNNLRLTLNQINTAEEQNEFLDKIKNFDVRQLEVAEKIERISPDMAEKMREKVYEKIKEQLEKAKDEKEKEKLLERIAGNDPKQIEVLKRTQEKLGEKLSEKAKASEVIGKLIVKQLEKVKERMGNLESEEKLDRLKKTVEESEKISPETKKEISEIKSKKICTMVWSPVCGVDNKTYSNECSAKAKDIEIAYRGSCKEESEEPGENKEEESLNTEKGGEPDNTSKDSSGKTGGLKENLIKRLR